MSKFKSSRVFISLFSLHCLEAKMPDAIAKPLDCRTRMDDSHIAAQPPSHGEDFYLSAFHLKNNLADPPIFFLIWALVEDDWKVVSYHVETH